MNYMVIRLLIKINNYCLLTVLVDQWAGKQTLRLSVLTTENYRNSPSGNLVLMPVRLTYDATLNRYFSLFVV